MDTRQSARKREDETVNGINFSRLYRTPEAAEILGNEISTLEHWRCMGKGPKFLRMGRSIKYRGSDLQDFIDSFEVMQSTKGACNGAGK